MLRYALVNDFDTNQVFEITRKEMFTLTKGMAIFMCMKDTERLSNETPMGVLAFHPMITIENDPEGAWAMMCRAIMDVRTEKGIVPVIAEPLQTSHGHVLLVNPIPPGDPRLN